MKNILRRTVLMVALLLVGATAMPALSAHATDNILEANKTLIRDCTEALNQRNFARLSTCYATALVDHNSVPGQSTGFAGYQQTLQASYTAFPNWHTQIDAVFADGDMVILRWTGTGTQAGLLLGIPAIGKPVAVTGISLFRVKDNQITETWGEWDKLAMFQQLGVLPLVGQAGIEGTRRAQ